MTLTYDWSGVTDQDPLGVFPAVREPAWRIPQPAGRRRRLTRSPAHGPHSGMMGAMRWYARPSRRMFWQVVADVFVASWLVTWWFLGRFVERLVRAIADPARQAAQLGTDVEQQLADVASRAGGVPVVGGGLSRPFTHLAGSVDEITRHAEAQVAAIDRAAFFLGWVVFLIPVVLMVAVWLPRRLRFARQAGATLALTSSAAGTQLLALRALVTQPLTQLQAVASDPVEQWRRGDPDTVEKLAALELARAGVTRPRRGR